ncbi:ATP-binding protein [Saccharospirillum sp. HFRX-1]|uniref:hybrid sensor histidine kinase/response regulator n=1 Tax=unclassified Saccharospirillum TaxID=2633430 RepID=UPI003717AC0E
MPKPVLAPSRKRLSLSRRLLVWIAGLFVTLVVLTTSIQLSLEYSLEEESGARDIAFTLASSRDVLANALWSFDPVQIEASADLLYEHPLITAVFIESEDIALNEWRGPHNTWPSPSQRFELNDYPDIHIESIGNLINKRLRFTLDIVFPANGVQYPVGRVEVYSDVGVILGKSWRNLTFTAISAVLLCVILVLVTAVSVRRLVENRLQAMQDVIATIEPEDDVFRAQLLPAWLTREGDEIGLLAVTLNRLQVQLADRSLRIKQHQQNLEQQIQQRTQQLEDTLTQLRISNAHKNEFLANMSHEIRTPMNGIIGMAELMQDSELSATQHDYLATILNSAQALTTILNDILDLSKIEAGKLELEIIDFDLPDLVDETLALFIKPAEDKGLALTVTLDPDLPRRVNGDPNRLRQLLLNLLGNALKFTDQGQIEVRVRCTDRPNQMHFEVSDTGIGISPDQQSALFDAFFQAHSQGHYGGTGLGLAICQRLVELMNGRIGFTSQPGQGSTFWFDIELSQYQGAPVQASAQHQEAPQRPLRPAHLLLVEDNVVNQRVAEGMLHYLGMSVVLAENGAEALARLQTEAFDLVLMDCEMPVMDGYEASRRIRALDDEALRRVPIIGLSAHAMMDHQREALQAGMDGYLTKPLRRQALAAMLARWLPADQSG